MREAILHWAARIREADIVWRTGIYPAEMAAFLGFCVYAGVKSIVESGRGPDAYSTQILGKFSDKTGIPVLSIDFAPIEKRPFAKALRKYTHLTCLSGNVFWKLPQAFRRLPVPSALLIDGPKETAANRLSLAACLQYPVSVVAHHNCMPLHPWYKEFHEIFPGAFSYEDVGLDTCTEWQQFRVWERSAVGEYEAEDKRGFEGRSFKRSSLTMALVPPREHLHACVKSLCPDPRRFHPTILRAQWSLQSLIGL